MNHQEWRKVDQIARHVYNCKRILLEELNSQELNPHYQTALIALEEWDQELCNILNKGYTGDSK